MMSWLLGSVDASWSGVANQGWGFPSRAEVSVDGGLQIHRLHHPLGKYFWLLIQHLQFMKYISSKNV